MRAWVLAAVLVGCGGAVDEGEDPPRADTANHADPDEGGCTRLEEKDPICRIGAAYQCPDRVRCLWGSGE